VTVHGGKHLQLTRDRSALTSQSGGQSKAKKPTAPPKGAGDFDAIHLKAKTLAKVIIKAQAVDRDAPTCAEGYLIDTSTPGVVSISGMAVIAELEPSRRIYRDVPAGHYTVRFDLKDFRKTELSFDVDGSGNDVEVLVRLVFEPKDDSGNPLDGAGIRQRIVDFAIAQFDSWHASGNRASWSRLNEFVTVVRPALSCGTISFPYKPLEWCGVFGCWVIKLSARPCAWWKVWDGRSGGIRGIGEAEGDYFKHPLSELRIGDVVKIKWSPPPKPPDWDQKHPGKPWNPQDPNHHVIVTAIDTAAGTFETVEGNTADPDQWSPEARPCMVHRTGSDARRLSQVHYYHRSVPLNW
jgi:hypothetical protein